MRPLLFSAFIILPLHAATEFGTIRVRQNNGGNESSSVTLTQAAGGSSSNLVTGGNRGDYNVNLKNTNDPAAGVLISCTAQTIRDDSAVGGPAAGPHHATTAIQTSGTRYYIPVFRSPEGDEANIDVSFVFLPYDTWLGGVAENAENGGNISKLTASPGLTLGTHFTDSTTTEGIYQLRLSPLVANASQNGILLVSGAKNEDNYALSKANTDGTFTIYCHDNGVNGTAYENDPVAFAYLPVSAVGTNRLVAMGRVNGNATTDISGGSFTVTKGGTGQWYIQIPGHSATTGVLIVSPEGGASNNADNIVSAEWDGDNGRWIVESRDLPDVPLQNMSSATEDAFSFAFFSTTANAGTPPTVSLTAPANNTTVRQGTAVTLSATATDDSGVSMVRFYDGEKLISEDRTAPYQFVWSNPPLGFHPINARATDNQGLVTRSSTANLSVTPAPGTGGLFFDGYNDYVNLGKPAAHQLTKFTVECWFRREPGGVSVNSGGLQAIPLIAKGRSDGTGSDFFLGIDEDSGKLAADFKDAAVGENHPLIGSTELTHGVWYHAAASFDGSAWKLYLNGNLEAEGDTGNQAPSPDADRNTTYGSAMNASGTPAGFFLGMMDEVRVWNRARTQAEIRGGMNAAPPSTTGLVTRHSAEEASGTTLTDGSGSGVTGTLTNGVFRTQGAPFNLNVPPDIEPATPTDQQAGVIHDPALTVTTTDPDNSSLTVRWFGRETDGGPLSDFSVVALPDTQWYSENEGGNLAAIFSAQTDWIVAQRNALKIAAVLHLGDITQNGDNPSTSTEQWNNASNAMYRLENPLTTMLPHGIPYSMAVGNHDQTPIGNADGTTTGFNRFFGVHPTTGLNHFRNKPYYGGTSVPDSADNNYITFTAGGLDFIVITFEYDTTPDAEDMAWADALLKSHPNHCGIITTHWTVGTGNPASFSPQGQAIYDALKGNPNLILMHGGHIAGEGRRSDTYQGRTVHSLLADYQSREKGGNGWLRILTFRPSLNRVEVQTYSPTLNRYETDADSRFNLDVDLSGRGRPFVELGSRTVAPGTSSLTWTGRAPATRYEWYAEVSDGKSVTRTPVRTFTTGGTQFPPSVSFTAPANGASFAQGTPVTLQVNATDSDGTVARVRYFSGTTPIGEATVAPFTFIWNDAPQGIHTLIARATDNSGLETAAMPVEIEVTAAPTVTLTTTDGDAGEFGPDRSLAFQVARTGSLTGDLDVRYTLSGTASPVVDFTALPGMVRIPSGQADAAITTTVLPDDLAEGPETLILTLSPNAAYVTGTPSSAQAVIRDRPLGAWLHARGQTAHTGDRDGNGSPDLIDYYTGSISGIRTISATGGVFTATFPRSKAAEDVTGEIQWSSDLVTWRTSGQGDGTRTATITTRTVSTPDADPETVEATLTITAGPPADTIFLRLAVRP
ncbi:MAG: metallophosphoesterase [Akkermansiaceae bacterium]|nr:metallophosphoesterase [Akkermansiaceae bacterium]